MTARARALLRVGLALALLLLAAWPVPGVALAFSRLYCPLASAVLAAHIFGERGHARLQPLPALTRRDGDSVTADAQLSLTIDGFAGTIPLGVCLRRDVYLPLLLALAVIACFPIAPRRRLACAAVAAAITLGAGIAANALVAAWTFATQLRGVYPPGDLRPRILQLAYGALLAPPGNRFIAPIVLGAVLVVATQRRVRPDRAAAAA
jgi:hypothetical protein